MTQKGNQNQITRALLLEVGAAVSERYAPHLKNAFLNGNLKLASEGIAAMERNSRTEFAKAFLKEGGKRLGVEEEKPAVKKESEFALDNEEEETFTSTEKRIYKGTLELVAGPALEKEQSLLKTVIEALLETASKFGTIDKIWGAVCMINMFNEFSEERGYEYTKGANLPDMRIQSEDFLSRALTGKSRWPYQTHADTMVTHDYMNEFHSLEIRARESLKSGDATPLKQKVLTYVEAYGKEFTDLVCDENRDRVAKLDELVERINRDFTDPAKFSSGDVKRVLNEAHELIYGKPRS